LLFTGKGEVGEEDEQIRCTRFPTPIQIGGAIAPYPDAQTNGRHPRGAIAAQTGFEIIANAILVLIGLTFAVAYSDGIGHVSIAVTGSRQNVLAATAVDGTWTIAHSAGIQRSIAGVLSITNAIAIRISRTISSAYAQCVIVETDAIVLSGIRSEIACLRVRAPECLRVVTHTIAVLIGRA